MDKSHTTEKDQPINKKQHNDATINEFSICTQQGEIFISLNNIDLEDQSLSFYVVNYNEDEDEDNENDEDNEDLTS